MNTQASLPSELVWASDGHLSELALTAIGDGQDAILPSQAYAHLEHCNVCLHGVGEAALLSLHLGGALQGMPKRTERAFPVLAVALALTMASVAALPMLTSSGQALIRAWATVLHAAPLLLRTAASLVAKTQLWLPLASIISSAILLLIGVAIARSAPRNISVQ